MFLHYRIYIDTTSYFLLVDNINKNYVINIFFFSYKKIRGAMRMNTTVNNPMTRFSLMITIITMIVFIFISANFINEHNNIQNSKNSFYAKVISYTFPALKNYNSNNSKYKLYDSFSLKYTIVNFLGINLNQPDSILKTQISYFKLDKDSTDSTDAPENNFEKVADFNLDDKDITKNTAATPDESNSDPSKNFVVYNPSLKNNNPSAKPEVFIYNTHTTESYAPYGKDNLDPQKNVCAVGDELAKTLSNDYGISVIHDTTIHNVEDYTGAYVSSRQTLEKYLKKYGDFKLIIDLHRDSEGNKNLVTTTINGQNLGKFMFVMTKGNPHYDKNMIIVNSLINTAKKIFPQLLMGDGGMYYYYNRADFFNQGLSNNAMLIEVGATSNTLDEAKGTSNYIARAIAEYLKGK